MTTTISQGGRGLSGRKRKVGILLVARCSERPRCQAKKERRLFGRGIRGKFYGKAEQARGSPYLYEKQEEVRKVRQEASQLFLATNTVIKPSGMRLGSLQGGKISGEGGRCWEMGSGVGTWGSE